MPAIGRADGEDEIPLTEKRSIGIEHGIARVVDAGRFRGRAVQLDDFEIPPGSQIFLVRISDVVTADVESGHLPGDFVNPFCQFKGPKPHSIPKYATLGVIACFHELEGLPKRQYLLFSSLQALMVFLRHKARTGISPD